MTQWRILTAEEMEVKILPYDPEKYYYTISIYAPYVTREPKNTVHVVRKLVEGNIGDYKYKTFVECHTAKGYRVRCSACSWTGYRNGYECACYDEFSYYCRPWSPGPGCPAGILWPCPQCSGHGHDWKIQ